MILEFSIQNYRSFKDENVFSMVAEASKSKIDNVFEKELSNGDKVRLLNSAVIYGPNASGKSNLLSAITILRKMIISLAQAGDPITTYDPYLFDTASNEAPTIFTITFVGPLDHKYIYKVEYNWEEILNETLDYYPKSQKRSLFKRVVEKDSDSLIHHAKLGSDYNNKALKVLKNQTILSKFGSDEPDELLTPIYLYFKDQIRVLGNQNLSNSRHLVEAKLHESPHLLQRLNKLIRVADTKIDEVILREDKGNDFYKEKTSKWLFSKRRKKYKSLGKHHVFNDNKKVDEVELSFDKESKGTNVLFVLGTLILEVLENGGVFLIDEIDTSLHPKLAKFLALLFKYPTTNPKNAQLIFTTHETTFLDKNIFRKDQIWFVEKNKYGESELISVQDFDNVREDTPFEKWYLAGKFGGIPEIKEIEFLFQDE